LINIYIPTNEKLYLRQQPKLQEGTNEQETLEVRSHPKTSRDGREGIDGD